MQNNDKTKKQKKSKFIQLLGANTTLYTLTAVLLLGIIILVYDQVSYIFKPFIIIINTIIAPIIISLVLFYLINPIINFMQKTYINRILAIIIVYLVIAFVHLILLNLLIPLGYQQIKVLFSNWDDYIITFNHSLDSLTQYGFLNDLTSEVKRSLNHIMKNIPHYLSSYINDPTHKLKSVFSALMNVTVVLMTTPFVLFFMLKDGPRFRYFIIKILPIHHRRDALSLIYQFNEKVGSYVQGQIIVAMCVGILLYLGYSLIGLKYALILALIAATTSVVPYLGPMIAISPAIIIALMTSPLMLLKLAIVWAVVQFFEGHFISPNVMGKTLQIHPLTIIFVLLCVGKIASIVGVILGIPMYAVIKVCFEFIFNKFKHRYNSIYGHNEGYTETDDINHIEDVRLIKNKYQLIQSSNSYLTYK